MPEYIERDKLYKHFEKSVTIHEATINGSTYPVYLTDHVLHEIRNAPAADVVEVNHGSWKMPTLIIFNSEKVGYRCSECNTTWDTNTRYCPYCGTKMDGKGD